MIEISIYTNTFNGVDCIIRVTATEIIKTTKASNAPFANIPDFNNSNAING
jgi:hypothetical protein